MPKYNLFAYRDLWNWINNPFEAPSMMVMAEQLSLNWTASWQTTKKRNNLIFKERK